jgi:predicted metal-binding membrane protein
MTSTRRRRRPARPAKRAVPEPPGGRNAFVGVTAVLFAASTAVTVAWCLSMSGMGTIAMPGGWTLSMAWMPMCGQTWAGTAAAFIGMWAVMMVAMMLPSLAPRLWRMRLALHARGDSRAGTATAWVAGGYFLVWTLLGAAVFAGGAAFAEAVMRWPALARAAPILLALAVLLAGAYQFTARRASHLASCRHSGPGREPAAGAAAAWRYGAWLGWQCSRACAGLTAILLAAGVMDLRAMAFMTAVITAERLAPAGERVGWAVGAASLVAGVYLMVGPAWP